MIRFYKDGDYDSVNNLLLSFSNSINIDSNPFYKCLVYEDKGILGVLIFEEIYDRIELDYIIVDNSYRRRGIASKLMDFLIEYSNNNNIINITLEVNENNISAINLYKKYKFELVSIREKYYNDKDALLMMRKFDNNE